MGEFSMETKSFNAIKLILIISFLSFLCININITFFGDDYHFLDFQNYGLRTYFLKLGEHYIKDNGRIIVHLLDTFFLWLPINLWRIVNSIMLTGICYLAMKIIENIFEDDIKNSVFVFLIILTLISALDISITRQSVYWITGSFNYVYPIFIFFMYWYFLNRIDKNKSAFIISIILVFLSAASVEQVGMMTVGLTFLTLISKIKTKMKFKLVILFIISLIGIVTVLLAPSQFIRLNTGDEINKLDLIFENIKFLVNNYTSVKNIFIYSFLFNLVSILYAKNMKKNKFVIFVCLLNITLNFLNIFLINYEVFSLIKIIFIIIIGVSYAITLILINKNLFGKNITPLTISVILMIGSQFMMIISPVMGYRNLLVGLIMFAFIIAMIGKNIILDKNNLKICCFSLIALTLINNLQTAEGYYKTKLIDIDNISVISKYKNEEEIVLKKFENDNYGWSMPYISPFHEEKFKNIYGITGNIRWE